MSSSLPRVSCLMVTADRPHLLPRALHCYVQQTYPNLDLVVFDNGVRPIEHLLEDVPGPVTYLHHHRQPGETVGALRNYALEAATGDFVVPQWDDDDWSHPERIERQMAPLLEEDYEACVLPGTLMHVDDARYIDRPFIGMLPNGVPPTIIHRRDADIRYPNTPRTHDTTYVNDWRKRSYHIMPDETVGLYVRYSHGSNLWEQEHFLRRLRNSPTALLSFLWHRYVRGNEFSHPRYQLSPEVQQAFEHYLDDSLRFDIFKHKPLLSRS